MNPHEAAARQVKTRKLVEAIKAELWRQGIRLAVALPAIERWTGAEWAKASVLAACRPPSAETRALALDHLRWMAAQSAEPCSTCGHRGGAHAGWCSREIARAS